ncbi:MAG: HD-GYP domain-containing protein, partial [Phycisphaerales bacterium]
MLRLTPSHATPGMVIALPVLHPRRPGHVLLKPGGVLDHEIIAALRELRIHSIWIEFPPTAFLLRYASPAVLAEHARLASAIGEQFDKVRADVRADFDFQVFTAAVRSLVHRLVDDDAASVFIDGIVAGGDPLLAHSANVGMLSLMMGLRLDSYLVEQRSRLTPRRAQNVENLGLGAVLCDLGMLHIDSAAAVRWWTAFDESDPAWRRHVLLGFERVRGSIPATAAGVVLHHHQRMDGSGFPRRSNPPAQPRAQRGGEIHIFSRIVAVADEFCRARTRIGADKPLAPAVIGLRRVVDLARAGKLDANVLRAMMAVVPAYMPGT